MMTGLTGIRFFGVNRSNSMRSRVLIPSFVITLCEFVVLVSIFLISLSIIKKIVVSKFDEMGDTAAKLSSESMEEELLENMRFRANDMAALIDEKLMTIQNITMLLSATATDYYTSPQFYNPRSLRIISEGEKVGDAGVTNLYISPNSDYSRALADSALAGNIKDLFEQVNAMDGDITASYLAGESGYFIITRNDAVSFTKYDARQRSWYVDAKEKMRLSWSAVYADTAGRGPTITCASPYFDGQKRLRGIAGNGVLLSNFNQIINSAAPGETTVVFLLDEDGRKLFASDGSGITINPETLAVSGEKLSESPHNDMRHLASEMTARKSGTSRVFYNGGNHYVAYHPLKTLNWSLGISVDEREITGQLNGIRSNISALAEASNGDTSRATLVIMIILAVVGAFLLVLRAAAILKLADRISTPVIALAHSVELVAGDNLDEKIDTCSQVEEIRRLASSFNEMKDRLREYIENLASVTAQKGRIDAELGVAAKIQAAMLPSGLERPEGFPDYFEINARMFPAREVGGDFYDYFFIDKSHFAVVIGDVSGKGVSAAMFMAIIKTLMHNYLSDGIEPDEAVRKLNLQLCENNKEDMFVTIWAGVFNPYTGRLFYVNAGHNPPLLKSGAFSYRYIKSYTHDLVVGIMEDAKFHRRELNLAPSDELFLYTDGVTEAFNRFNNMYGEERLNSYLNAHYEESTESLITGLHSDIQSFAETAEPSDDITMLVLRCVKRTEDSPPEELAEIIEEEVTEELYEH